MYYVKVDGTIVKICRSFDDAKRSAVIYKGKIYHGGKQVSLPKTVMVDYGDSNFRKREMISEIYGDNNHGFHVRKYYI